MKNGQNRTPRPGVERRKADGKAVAHGAAGTAVAGPPSLTSTCKTRVLCMLRRLTRSLDRLSGTPELDDKTYAALTDRLYGDIALIAVGPAVYCVVLALVAFEYASDALWIIAGVMAVIGGLRVKLHESFARNRSRILAAQQWQVWEALFMVSGTAFAATLGIAATVVQRVDSQADIIALALMLSFTSMIGVRNASRAHVVATQLLAVLAPFVLSMLLQGGYVHNIIAAGLTGYVIVTVRLSASVSRMQLESVMAQHTLHAIAHTDSLTGLPNRLDFEEQMAEAVASGRVFTLAMIDLDDFKTVNDGLGHDVGDELIKGVAERLGATIRHGDYVARIGGDEFITIQNGALDQTRLDTLNRISRSFDQPFHINGHVVRSSASIGAADTSDLATKRDVIKAADIALYHAKACGKNNVSSFSPDMWERKERATRIIDELGLSIEQRDVEMVFQPIVCIESGKVKCMEALMRWTSPTYGPVSPGEFIPLAEQSRLIVPLTFLSIEKAMEAAALWPAEVKVAINLSAAAFYDAEILQQAVLGSILKYSISPERIEFEITETTLIASLEQVTKFIAAMRAWQIRVNLDDFGVGYSSLAYIQTMDFAKVKVDKAFIDNIVSDYRSRAIVASVNYLCTQLNMSMVVEGVEQAEQMMLAAQCGVREGQGYYFDRPLPAAEVMRRFSAGTMHYGESKRFEGAAAS